MEEKFSGSFLVGWKGESGEVIQDGGGKSEITTCQRCGHQGTRQRKERETESRSVMLLRYGERWQRRLASIQRFSLRYQGHFLQTRPFLFWLASGEHRRALRLSL